LLVNLYFYCKLSNKFIKILKRKSMIKNIIQKYYKHLIAIIAFILISYAYFSPLLEGKVIQQGDKTTFLGMSKEVRDFRDNTGDEALWTNSMLGGMMVF
jgi:uncharacterized membrane protein YbaN (DUF454 family)